jgi:hypothetical protein
VVYFLYPTVYQSVYHRMQRIAFNESNQPHLGVSAAGRVAGGRVPALPVAAGVPRQPAGSWVGGRAHLPNGDSRRRPCRLWWRRQGGCRVWWRRQGGCRHWWRRQVVFFDKNFERWSFLTLRWRRWSLLSKIRFDVSQSFSLHTKLIKVIVLSLIKLLPS